MNKSNPNIPSSFESKEEAFEFLIQMSQNNSLRNQWEKELDQSPTIDARANRKSRYLYFRKASAIAASFIFLLGSFYWFTNQQETLQHMVSTMINETNFVLETSSMTRGTDENEANNMIIKLQEDIQKALEKEDYEASVGLYLTKEQKNELSLEDKFYYSLSLSRSENGDYYKAINLLQDITSQEDKYYNEALWLKGLLHLKLNQIDESKIILNKLINKSNYQLSNTKALLEKIAD